MSIKTELTFEPMDDEWRVVIHDMFFISFNDMEHAQAFKNIIDPLVNKFAVGVGEIGDIDGLDFTSDN